MRTAEEIAKDWGLTHEITGEPIGIEAMKEYASQEVRKHLKIASEKASLWVETPINGTEFKEVNVELGDDLEPFTETITVFKQSITNIKINLS